MQRVDHAKDLGVCFGFKIGSSRSKGTARLQDGLRRLDRLCKEPRTFDNKAHLIQTGVWAQAFYGQEGRSLSASDIQTFRSKAARAVCDTGPSQSPVLALSALTTKVMDPEVYLLVQAVMALRRAYRFQPSVAVVVWKSACEADVMQSQVCGPGTALACMLQRNGWTPHEDGWCKGPGAASFSVKVSGRKQIARAIQHAWSHQVPEFLEHRNGLHALGPIAVQETTAANQQMPQKVRPIMVNCVTGGHMAAAARAKWDALVEPRCMFCGEMDTKGHRVFSCPLFRKVRPHFQPMLDWVAENAPHWPHAAVITCHPDEHVLPVLFAARPCIPPPMLTVPALNKRRVLFTDGSCTVPFCVRARHAAWAVVLDAAADVPVQTLLVEYVYHKKVVPTFHVVAQGTVPRTQTIGRAEICALLQVCLLALREPEVAYTVYSDSTYAIGFLEKLKDASTAVGVPQPSTDYDLCEWANVWTKPHNLTVCKVASHKNPEQVPLEELRGNTVADAAAKAAREADIPSVLTLLQAIDLRQRNHYSMLCSYFRFQEACAAVVGTKRRHEFLQDLDDADPAQQYTKAQQLQAWKALQPEITMQLAWPPFQSIWWEAAPWPPWFTHAVWNWAVSLKWPPREDRCHTLSGVTLLEMLANFVLMTGCCPPIRVGQGTTAAEVDPMSQQGSTLPMHVKEATLTFSACIRYLEAQSKTRLMLAQAHRKVRPLQTLGCHTPRRGFVPRPVFGRLDETGELVLQLLQHADSGDALRTSARGTDRQVHGQPGTDMYDRWRERTFHQRAGQRRSQRR